MLPSSGVKYIGSKRLLLQSIVDTIGRVPRANRVIDAFTGTTRVAQALKASGYEVITSDLSWASTCYSNTFISNPIDNAHLNSYIEYMNRLEGKAGWLTENYCQHKNGVKVWQVENGKKADAIRDYIDTLMLAPWESATLVTSLIFALDAVDNTVGVQQAYLKEWCRRSYNPLTLKLPVVRGTVVGQHIEGDCMAIEYPSADVAYLDPPYSAHSYATYYHIWDSIARWDKPETALTTNRRVDRVKGTFDATMVSDWNSKASALSSLIALIDKLPVPVVVLSYNNEGLIGEAELMSALAKYKIEIEAIDFKRHIMSSIGNSLISGPASRNEVNNRNLEFLITITK
jgi:adenine-specific DNA-methyltransferase